MLSATSPDSSSVMAATSVADECFDYRNTYIGAEVASQNWRKGAQVLFEADIIQNLAGGVVPGSAGFTIKDDECHGKAEIVDETGKLSGSFKDRFFGRRGSQIARPKP